MIYLVYKTTNLVNGKIYVGCHKTENIDDGYLGSGKVLTRAIKKYGEHNFKREIIAQYNNPTDMFNMEAVIVNEEFIKDKDTYNIVSGGNGGFEWINKTGKNLYGKNGENGTPNLMMPFEERKRRMIQNGTYESYVRHSKERLAKYRKENGCWWTGKTHTDETKKLISQKAKIHQKGKRNSQYGTCWIYHPALKQNKKIKKDELNIYISEGWFKGRKLNP